MMFKIKSRVNISGMWANYEHEQWFNDSLNVFGRVYEYHLYMMKLFPNCKFEFIDAREVIK